MQVINVSTVDWKRLLMLKRSIKMYKEAAHPRYQRALDKYSELYSQSLEELRVA